MLVAHIFYREGSFMSLDYKKIINYIITQGAEYADIRVHEIDKTESISFLNNELNNYDFSENVGFGIRVLVNGAWGFCSSEILDEENLKSSATKAIENAKSASSFIKHKVKLSKKEVYQSQYSTPTKTNPFDVPLEDKLSYLASVNKKLSHERFDYWKVWASFFDRKILYYDSEGAEIERNILDISAGLYVDGKDKDGLKQRRTFGLFHYKDSDLGWESLLSKEQFDQSERIKEELLSVLDASECEEEVCDVILLPEMMALQTHETIGHALELDRILGYELSYAGGSHVDLQHFGELQFGSDKLTARADGTVKCSPGSTGFDDDGVKAKNVVMIEKGRLINAITSRQMIIEANEKADREIFKESGAACRAQSYNCLPIERMNNINVDPGNDGTLEDIIKSCDNGIILETPRSWSIGSNRENFHFATEIGWKVKNGKITGVVRNATYRGKSLEFWKSLDKVGDASTWQVQPTFNCGKGQPNQVMRLGHGVPVCLFKNVEIGK